MTDDEQEWAEDAWIDDEPVTPSRRRSSPLYQPEPQRKSTGLIVGLAIAGSIGVVLMVALVVVVLRRTQTPELAALETPEELRDESVRVFTDFASGCPESCLIG